MGGFARSWPTQEWTQPDGEEREVPLGTSSGLVPPLGTSSESALAIAAGACSAREQVDPRLLLLHASSHDFEVTGTARGCRSRTKRGQTAYRPLSCPRKHQCGSRLPHG